MKKFKEEIIKQQVLESVICDDCKKEFDVEKDVFEIQEFVSISFTGGYVSIFGDMTQVTLDLCQHCFNKRCGDVVRTKDMY